MYGQKLVGTSPHFPIRPDSPAYLAIKLIDSAYAIDGSFTRATIHQLRPVNTGTPLGRPRRTAATMPPTPRRRGATNRHTDKTCKQLLDNRQWTICQIALFKTHTTLTVSCQRLSFMIKRGVKGGLITEDILILLSLPNTYVISLP